MTASLAQLLDARLPALAAMPPNGMLPTGDPDSGAFHYSVLLSAVRDDDYSAWFAALRSEGAARAAAGAELPALLGDTLQFLNAIRATVFADLPRSATETRALRRQLDDLQTEVLAALVRGYFEGQEKRADEQRLALEELAALFKINSAANSTLDFDQVLDRVVEEVTGVMRADICSLFIYEPEIDRLVLRATRGLARDAVGRVRLRLGEGVTGWAGRAGKPLALSDGWRDDRFFHVPGLGEERTRAILAVPIVLFTKIKLVGVITLQSNDERHFTERDISFLETVAGEVAIAIENARLHRDTDERLRQKVAEMTILQGVSASIAATLDLQEVARLIASEAVHLMGVDAAVLYELREERLVPTAAFGFQPGEGPLVAGTSGVGLPATPIPLPLALAPESSLVARAILAGRPVGVEARQGAEPTPGHVLHTIADAASLTLAGVGMDDAAPLWLAGEPDGLPFATRLGVPLLAPRSIVGGIFVYSRAPRFFGEEAIRLLLAFAREGAIAIENAHLYEEARRGLRMQTLLLREMHHRVRNNLQRTASLLRMQANRLPDDNAARHPLQESVIRIQSIARVHDLLSRQQVGLTEVGAVANLAWEVVSATLGRPDLHVRWNMEAPPLLLSSREAFPLTLLLAELLSNALLHGFAGREHGEVTITAEWAGADLVLIVSDDGVGLPPGFDAVRDAHLGLEVVRRLGEQELGGNVIVAPNPTGAGVCTTVAFPYQPPSGPDPTEADRELGAVQVGI
ncbi:MAG TPA: GAF domain-containing protein [Chloroflexia bacterium]|nr:GAF domain-containing protein [Chloroflexia bacterium]